MSALVLIVILAAAALVFAVPVRRLILDGRSGGVILGYVLILGALAFGVSELRPLARYLLPILGLVYIAPFVTVRGGIDRLLGRRQPTIRVSPAPTRAIEAPRDVTPDDASPPDLPPAEAPTADDGHAAQGQGDATGGPRSPAA